MPDSDRKDLTETYHNFASHLQPGSSISSRYKIVKLLGIGGMGRVYLARDEDLNIDVALKLIRPELLGDDSAVDRFKNELILARKVSHKNVARIHDLGEIDGLKFLTMSYIPGKTLRDVIRESGPFSVERAVGILIQIAEGTSAAHEEGVIHRDLKPANILLDESERAYVTDFGIARSLDQADQTAAGVLLGTPAYLSPEQTWGEKADTRSDLYSLGLVLYEMLTGQLPFDQTTAHAFRTRLPADLDSRIKRIHPQLPAYLIAILRKCLHPNRELRYQSTQELLHDLQTQKVKSPFRVNRVAVLGVLIAAILLAAFLLKEKWMPESGSDESASAAKQASVQSILVLPFVNKTGTPELKWTESGMADMLIADLSQDPQLRVISPERLHQTIDDLKMSGSNYSEEEIKRLSEILNADWILQGSLIQSGQGLRADVKIAERNRVRTPAYIKAEGNRKEDVLQISVSLASQIQKYLNSGSRIESIAETQSLPALESYNLGKDLLRHGDFQKAAQMFEQTVQQDPKFARAYLNLSEAYDGAGDYDRSIQALEAGLRIVPINSPRTRRLLLAQQALSQGELENAIRLYEEFSREYPNDSEVLFSLARAYEDAGDLKRAVEVLERLIAIDPNHPEAYFHMGKDTILMGDAERAINQHLFKAVSIHKQLNNRYGEADALNAIGVGYERLGKYDESVRHYEDSIAIKQEIGNQKGTATSLSNIAKIYIFQGEHEKAKDYLTRARTIFEELQDKKGIADSINQFGVISEDQGQHIQALAYYKNALQIRKEMGNDQLTAQSYDNIGHIYYLQGKFDDAEVFWQQALNLRKSIGEESGIILSLQNMGFLDMAQGQLDKAVKSFMEALHQSRAIQYENAIAVSMGNLGAIHQMQGRYQAALDSYTAAIQVLEKLKDKKGIAEYTKMTGSVYLELNLIPQALDKLKAALKNAEETQSAEIVAETEILLARAYRMQKDFANAQIILTKAFDTASDRQFKRIRLRARIEQGWLDLENTNKAMLPDLVNQAKELRDPWLELQAGELSAIIGIKNNRIKQSAEMITRELPLATKLKSLPFLYKFHSLAAKAHGALGSEAKVADHQRDAAKALLEMKTQSPRLTGHL